MKITKILVNTKLDIDTYKKFENELKLLIGDFKNHIAESKISKYKSIIYFYYNDDKLINSLIDLLLDYRMLLSIKEISKEVKDDYTQFKDIDNIHNFNLLDKFFQSEYNIDWILDFISANGKDKFDDLLANRFFRDFYKKIHI